MSQRSTIESADGTTLSVSRRGRGTPIVCVHGLCGQPQDFALLWPHLEEQHEVWLYARRGRGGSGDGDGDDYGLEHEVQDLLAVIAAVEGPVHLFGHSLGGAISVLAAPQADLRSLIVYEPALLPHLSDERPRSAGIRAVAEDDLDAAVASFAELAGITDEELEQIRSVPAAYEGMKRASRTAPRELAALHELDPERWRSRTIDVPSLVLTGERTSVDQYAGKEDLAEILTDGSFFTIPGQGHLGTIFAADEVASRILEFTAQVDASTELSSSTASSG
ncbi:MAG: alpha/beta hydrolase [Nitriliruptorales bacterium]|nr:alpha/beta hydrolase [Nitriliruptorales bacterium]